MGDERRVAQPGPYHPFPATPAFDVADSVWNLRSGNTEIHRTRGQSPGYQGRRDVPDAVSRAFGIPLERPGSAGGLRTGERERLARELALVGRPFPARERSQLGRGGKAELLRSVPGIGSFFADLDRFWRPDFKPDQQVSRPDIHPPLISQVAKLIKVFRCGNRTS